MTATVKALAEITDEGLFERLAMAVLRDHDPRTPLVHCGVNAAGKTIKGPVDGIGIVPADGGTPRRLIAVHHTIAARRDLRRKWMHQPAQQSAGRRAEPGDFVKTRRLVDEERVCDPKLAATLVLTSSVDPHEDLVREVADAGRAAGIDIEFWSGSRLAHHLDVTANGQWIRRQHLGVEPERLSAELLAFLSSRSLECFGPPGEPGLWVPRALDGELERALDVQPGVFLAAEGGLGKSVACHRLLRRHVGRGGYGLVVTERTAEDSISLEQAVGAELRKLHPQLAEGCEDEALALCTDTMPFLVVCEDVNRSARPQALIERLGDWIGRKQKPWRLVCPMRPDVVAALGDQQQRGVRGRLLMATAFRPEEGRAAVAARARAVGVEISELDATQLSLHLGHDPLLIALHEIGAGRYARVIDDFIDCSVRRLAASTTGFSGGELRQALLRLADRMLRERRLDPEWDEVGRWFAEERDVVARLRALVGHREVARLSTEGPSERILFRHDRVRDALLADALAEKLTSGAFDDEALGDPFFAEQLGSALLRDGAPEGAPALARRRNPLALFGALREFGEPDTPFKQAVVAQLRDWLGSEDGRARQNATLRWQAANMLAGTTSAAVPTLAFPEVSHPLLFALFRNGSLDAGLALCRLMEPGITAPWYDRQIAHVLARFGRNLVDAIGAVLERTDIDSATRMGALRLASYTKDDRLAYAIKACWNADAAGRDRLLEDYLRAAAHCCGDLGERLLGPICDAWGRLPRTTRDNLAAEHVRWAFGAVAPVRAIGFFVARAAHDDLKWPLLYMLHEVDHPDALEFAVRRFADVEAAGSFVPYASNAGRRWGEKRRRMSPASRARLLLLWSSVGEEGPVRRQAFRLWTAAGDRDDVELLRAAHACKELAHTALSKRLEYGDRSATGAVLSKLDDPRQSYHWWREVPPIWSDELSAAVARELGRRRDSITAEWGANFPTDLPVSELLMSIAPDEAERHLTEHWDHLRLAGPFVLAALYVASPELVRRAGAAVRDCPTPTTLFQHLDIRYGIHTVGRPGLTRREQVEALAPHIEHLDGTAIHTLWCACNEKGWFDLRRRSLDDRVDRRYGHLFLDSEAIEAQLDELAEPGRLLWVGHELDAWMGTGASLDEIMTFVDAWFGRRLTIGRMQVAAAAVAHAGTRRHLAILDREVAPAKLAGQIRFDAAFRVRRRALQ